MNARQRNLIVTLMVLALAGLTAFQVYWINNALKLSRTQFRRNVQESLVQVANRLEQDEAVRVTANSFFVIRESDSPMVIDLSNKDSVSSRVYITDKDGTDKDSVWTSRRDSGTMTLEFRSDSLHTISPAKWKMKKRKELVDVAFNRILRQEKVNIHERIPRSKLDTLLKTSLREKGIAINYSYGIVEENREGGDSLVIADTKVVPSEILASEFRASLFPNDLDGAQHFLAVYFPGQSSFILRKITTTLAASIIFIAVIFGCFYYTMRVIGKQKQMSRIKSDFINNMTHEFKTPIATISLATQVLSEAGITDNSTAREKYINVIRDENERLAQQVERVLQSSLMENNELVLKKQRESLHAILDELLLTFTAVNPKTQVNKNYRAIEDTIHADAHHIKNVFNNLFDNAYKYSPAGCSLRVLTENRDGKIIVSVSDNGIGMDSRQLRHIFESFYRIPTGNLHDVKGFGLGLSYVRRIVDLHNGQIDVQSVPGKGSTFTIEFANVE